MSIHLRSITKENWEDCIDLRVADEQRGMVASNLYLLAESKFHPNLCPYAIYYGETMVGFVMYGLDPDDHNYWVYRLMVDQQHQRKGYGRAGLLLAIEQIRSLPDCREIVLGFKPGNTSAEELYRSVGFTITGELIGGELVDRLKVSC